MILLFSQFFSDPNVNSTMPISLLSIGSYLKSKGVPCKIYDLFGLAEEDIKDIVETNNPRIVGISCQFTPHYKDVLSLAKMIKEVNPEITIVLGGNHASSLNKCDENIDYIIQGEGEVNFYEFYMNPRDGVKIRKPYPLQNLDSFPKIDYSMIDMTRYKGQTPFLMRKKTMGIITSRGCPNNCIYCTVKGVWGRTWRGKSAKRTVDEIEQLIKLGYTEFSFLDDSASVNKERWGAICDEIIKRKLNIRWTTPNGIAHWTLDKSILKKMKQAGCYRITLGIESGNKAIRKFIRKPYPLSQAKEIIQEANRLGMWTISTNILGFPGETEEQMNDTLDFAIKSGVDFACFFVLDSYPTADISKYKLDLTLAKSIQFKFYKKFITHRLLTSWNILLKIRNLEDLRYTFRLAVVGVKILFRVFYKTTTKDLLYV